jgi:hypothetical protein
MTSDPVAKHVAKALMLRALHHYAARFRDACDGDANDVDVLSSPPADVRDLIKRYEEAAQDAAFEQPGTAEGAAAQIEFAIQVLVDAMNQDVRGGPCHLEVDLAHAMAALSSAAGWVNARAIEELRQQL